MEVSSLSYDAETGKFFRNGVLAGGSDCSKGYRRIMWQKKRYKEHVLAWYFFYKEWPTFQIDHINQNKSDNRICNLRQVTQSKNMYNKTKCHKNNNTGFLGVSKSGNKFVARLKVKNKLVHLGTFNTAKEANKLYEEFKQLIYELD